MATFSCAVAVDGEGTAEQGHLGKEVEVLQRGLDKTSCHGLMGEDLAAPKPHTRLVAVNLVRDLR